MNVINREVVVHYEFSRKEKVDNELKFIYLKNLRYTLKFSNKSFSQNCAIENSKKGFKLQIYS